MQGQVLVILSGLLCVAYGLLKSMDLNCKLKSEFQKEIENYKPVVQKIFAQVVNGPASGKIYNYLSDFGDRFGFRLTGSVNLENSITDVKNLMTKYKLENVKTEPVMVPVWVRGKEYAELRYPHYKKLSMLGLGGSIATPVAGITAEVLVVKTFDELKEKAGEAAGKIVVFNQDFVNYGGSVQYRLKGASEAAAVGAVAALIRSVTDFSINTPHAGRQEYESGVWRIPAGSITVEDSEMLWRMFRQNETKLVIHLKMEAKNLREAESRNTIGEIAGKSSSEIVLTSGHIDSWDVGSGIMDDAAGAFISWYSLAILKQLNLRARRSIRTVLWTAEEQGLIGAKQYYKTHYYELGKLSAVMESDLGTFRPTGLGFTGNNDAACIIAEILKLFAFANASTLQMPAEGSDISVFEGIPQISLSNDNARYFWFHHTAGDSLQVEDSGELDKCVAVWASAAYVIADISVKLPRGNNSKHWS